MNLDHPLLKAGPEVAPPFPTQFPQLKRLDNSLTCEICKETYSGPVSISCGHSFCSQVRLSASAPTDAQCIRSSLDAMTKKRCPVCDETTSEGKIRRNRALEEIVDAWELSRPAIYTLTSSSARKRPPPEPNSKASSSTSENRLKRSRLGASRSASPQKAVIELESDESDLADEVEELSESGGGSGNQKADWKKVFGGLGKGKETEMKRLTKPNSSIISPAELRAILSEHGLQTAGEKPALVARLHEWIILYNSNLDTSHPKSLSYLRARLNEAEASRKRDKERGKDAMVEDLETKEGKERYALANKSAFDKLRRDVQERDRRRAEKEKGSGAETAIEVE
ncbi:E3 ubiquitin-protein ligase RAD18, partial [Tremellales sp. Uapishka_1]